jgi:hypothetical protein
MTLMLAKTRLVAGRSKSMSDKVILAMVNALPPAGDDDGEKQTVGICNRLGEVYRQVEVFSSLQLLYLTARLNTLGYSLDGELRSRLSSRYVRIFVRRDQKKIR